jgi:hypothetical protein
MGVLEILALSAAGNILLVYKLLKAKSRLRRAVHSIVEVSEGRAEVVDLGDRIAVRHKLIQNEDNVTL